MQNQDTILQKLNDIEQMLNEQADEVLTFEQACQYLDVSKFYLYRLTSTRKIPHFKPRGKRIYFSKRELASWLLRNPVPVEDSVE